MSDRAGVRAEGVTEPGDQGACPQSNRGVATPPHSAVSRGSWSPHNQIVRIVTAGQGS